jgi:hypothetical protein
MRPIALLAAVLASAAATPGETAQCRVEGTAHVAPVVELYTSEGCNSCPPADRWLSARFQPGARRDVIPLAFHVDYWDRLGWRDRFASAAASERQSLAARANASTFVYTPQVLLQGRDFPGWRHDGVDAALAAVASRPATAALVLEATADGVSVDAVAHARAPAGASLVVALVDSGHATDVEAGENKGERLLHDHVVRALATRTLAAGNSTVRLTLPRHPPSGTHPTVVALVQDQGRGAVLQAVALPLRGCDR